MKSGWVWDCSTKEALWKHGSLIPKIDGGNMEQDIDEPFGPALLVMQALKCGEEGAKPEGHQTTSA